MTYDVDWVDAFTDQPFGGNGCAVVYDADALSIADRLALVRETKLSECAFLVRSDKADFGARYYLADREILMAGHPTVATIRSLIHRGHVAVPSTLTLEVGAGVLPITVTGTSEAPLITMTQMRPSFGAECTPEEVAAIYGLRPDMVIGTPQLVSTGSSFCITVLNGRGAVEKAVLDTQRLAEWRTRHQTDMEPFLVALEGATENGQTFARLLLAPPHPPEDPFTGSATGCMAAYLWAKGLIESPCFVAEQGHGMGRPGQAQVEVLGPRNAITGIRVGGQGMVVLEGRLLIP